MCWRGVHPGVNVMRDITSLSYASIYFAWSMCNDIDMNKREREISLFCTQFRQKKPCTQEMWNAFIFFADIFADMAFSAYDL